MSEILQENLGNLIRGKEDKETKVQDSVKSSVYICVCVCVCVCACACKIMNKWGFQQKCEVLKSRRSLN